MSKNFFDQFDDPAAEALGNKPVLDARRAAAEEARANAREARAAAAESRAAEEHNVKFNATTPPGDVTQTGEAYLATLPPGMAAQVRAIAEGRRALPNMSFRQSPQAQAIAAAAMQYDPTLDAANAATRMKTRVDFTSGASAKNRTAINTAIGHIASLARAAKTLNNSTFPAYNSIANWISSETGNSRVNDFNLKRNAVASELTRVFRGTGGNVHDLKEWETSINSAQSPQQLQDAITSAMELLNSRLNALNEQYSTGMGKSSDPMEMLTPHARQEYDALTSGEIFGKEANDKVGLLEKPPAGAELQGAGVKGYRFTPEQEAALLREGRGENFDPNAFAQHVTQFALQNGSIKPEQAADFQQRALASAAEFGKAPAEQRAQGSINYSDVDRAAASNMGLGTALGTALSNVPTSAFALAKGTVAPVADTIVSALQGQRVGTFKTFTDLAAEAAGKLVGQKDAPTIDALAQAMRDRYGSIDALKKTAIEDPVGLSGDLSLALTGGGNLAARAGRLAGASGLESAGRGVATAGRMIDPLSGGVALAENAPRLAAAIPQGVRRAAVEAPTELLAMPSGVGGQSLREGAAAGFERGRTGAPTERSQGFTQSMRDPGSTADDMVTQAREAIGNLRAAASQRYQAAMSRFGRQPQPLDITRVQQRIARMRPRNYDAMLNAPGRPADHVAWEQLRDTVNHYADQAVQDPSLLMPLQLDAFKQDLYDIGSRVGGAYDRNAARMAREAYDGVRQELIRHDPVYADTMANYERAAREAQQLEGTFGLAAARGKQVNIDSAARKLQSIMRNNASTNYGRRAVQGERLNDLGNGALMANLAGQSASAWTPRGVRIAAAPGAVYAASAGALPITALSAALASPRTMGELSYGAGRAAGTIARGVDAAMGSGVGQVGQDLARRAYDLYQRYPTAALASGAAARTAGDTDEERLRRAYGIDMPEEY